MTDLRAVSAMYICKIYLFYFMALILEFGIFFKESDDAK